MPTKHHEKQLAQQELYSKLTEAASEIERGEKKCVDAEKFLKELMKDKKRQNSNG